MKDCFESVLETFAYRAAPMSPEEAREKIACVAEQLCIDIHREQGYTPRWRWLDPRRLRLYDRTGQPLMTFNLDTLQ